jgi:hypothetical protein
MSATVLAAAEPSSEWIELFNGHNLEGWRSNHPDSWKVSGGLLIGSGPTSHLFYNGSVRNATIRNFDLVAEIKTSPRRASFGSPRPPAANSPWAPITLGRMISGAANMHSI